MMGSQILNCPEQQDCHGSEMAQHGGSYPGGADLLLLLSFSHLVLLPSTPSPPCFLPTVPHFLLSWNIFSPHPPMSHPTFPWPSGPWYCQPVEHQSSTDTSIVPAGAELALVLEFTNVCYMQHRWRAKDISTGLGFQWSCYKFFWI